MLVVLTAEWKEERRHVIHENWPVSACNIEEFLWICLRGIDKKTQYEFLPNPIKDIFFKSQCFQNWLMTVVRKKTSLA
jgi:hypothetical protein